MATMETGRMLKAMQVASFLLGDEFHEQSVALCDMYAPVGPHNSL